MKTIHLILLLVFTSNLFSQLKLIKDINPGTPNAFNYDKHIVAGGVAYFAANDGVHGLEIWMSDGTENGTRLVKDIYPGKTGCNLEAFGTSGGLIYFLANDSLHGKELWRTDGTEAGTQLVFDSKPGIANGSIYVPFSENETFAAADSKMYFLNSDEGLYESDGTVTGTRLVIPLNTNYFVTAFNNKIFVVGSNGASDSIFVFDPVNQTTQTIPYDFINPRDLVSTPLGILLISDEKLFRIDSDLNVHSVVTNPDIQGYNITYGAGYHKDHYYFTAYDVSAGSKKNLYKTNGTEAGTELFLDVGINDVSSYGQFCSEGDNLFFLFNSEDGQPTELWRTDGTVPGTIKLAEYESSSLDFITPFNEIIGRNGLVYYFQEINRVISLYQSDGTITGTNDIAFIHNQSVSRQLTLGIMELDAQMLFSANVKDPVSIGEELWSYALAVGNSEINHDPNTVDCYPNPVIDKLHFNLNNQQLDNYFVTDVMGNIKMQQTELENGNQIDFSLIEPGVYFIQIFTPWFSRTLKVLKL